MGPQRNQESATEQTIDWDDARRRLSAGIAYHLGRSSPQDLEDLTSEGLIQLLRVIRQEGVRNVSGLITVIARTTAIDEIRHRQRETVRHAEIESPMAGLGDSGTDRTSTLWFVMIEFFRTRKAPCHTLALRFAE